jgi:vitamin B12 transporter
MTQRKRPTATTGAFVTSALCTGLVAFPNVGHTQSTAAQERPEEIIVTSSLIPTPRRRVGTAVSVIEGTDIQLRGFDGLADLLRTQTGIAVSNSGGPGKSTALRIRGEEAYRTMLMIDGVKAVDPTATQAAPGFDSLLTTSDMERVEILRGPQGFMYGADAGGVVSIITGKGVNGFGGQLGIESGEFATRRVSGSLSGGNDSGDFYFSATELDTDGFNAQSADTVLRDDDGADNTTLHAKLGWNVSENLRLQVVARDIDASTRYDSCYEPITFAGPLHDCVGTTEQTTYKISAVHHSGSFTNTFGYSDVDIARDYFTQGVSSFATEGGISRFEYTGSYEASAATTLAYGLDLEDEDVTSDGDELDRSQDGYYVEYQGRFGDSFFLSAGARYDDNDDFGTHTSSRVSGAYTQEFGGGNSLKYRASVGTGFRGPSLFEVSYNDRPFGVLPAAAATSLLEETSHGYDVGIELDAANGLHLEATYFDQDIEDAIVYASDVNFNDGYLQSQGTSTSKGVELGVRAPFSERWAFVGNWTNNDTKTVTGQPRLLRPKNLGNLGVEYTSMNTAFRFVANYRLSKDAIDFGGTPLDDYEVLDLSMAYSFNKTFELYGRMQNAADEEYAEVIGYNTPGRETYAGVRLRF